MCLRIDDRSQCRTILRLSSEGGTVDSNVNRFEWLGMNVEVGYEVRILYSFCAYC